VPRHRPPGGGYGAIALTARAVRPGWGCWSRAEGWRRALASGAVEATAATGDWAHSVHVEPAGLEPGLTRIRGAMPGASGLRAVRSQAASW
jgi:hypothetical protein